MKAAGKVLKAELDYVKNVFSHQFGNHSNREHLQVLKSIFGRSRKSSLIAFVMIFETQNAWAEVRVSVGASACLELQRQHGDVAESEMRVIQSIAHQSSVYFTKALGELEEHVYRDVHSGLQNIGCGCSLRMMSVKKAYRKNGHCLSHPDTVADQWEKNTKKELKRNS